MIALIALVLSACASQTTVENESLDEQPASNVDATGSEVDAATAAASGPLDVAAFDRLWSAILAESVQPRTGRVDYQRLQRRQLELHMLLNAAALPRRFNSIQEHLAFVINTYNVLVVTAIVDYQLTSSVRNVDAFFSNRRFEFLGQRVSLDDIRDQHARRFGDPRVHMALCYGAIGSPPLRAEAYSADKLGAQLDDQSRRFVNDPAHNTTLGDSLLLSPVFNMFADDFAVPPYDDVLGFVFRYAEPRSSIRRVLIEAGAEPPIVTVTEFNWALNAR